MKGPNSTIKIFAIAGALMLPSYKDEGAECFDNAPEEVRTEIIVRITTTLKEKLDPELVYFALNSTPFLETELPIFAEDPNSPIFIILGDIHGSPEIEKTKLEKLKTCLGIDFVGVEGWAGHEVDQKRGYRCLNGEEELITDLLEDDRFQVVGLEDPEMQIEALAAVLAQEYIVYVTLHYSARLGEKDFLKEAEKLGILARSLSPEQEEDLAEGSFGVLYKVLFEGYKDTFNMNDIREMMEVIRKGMKILGINEKELEPQQHEDSEAYRKRKYAIFKKARRKNLEHALAARSKMGVKLMLEQMKEKEQRVGIMVFGNRHVDEIVSELQNALDCSIFVVKRPELY